LPYISEVSPAFDEILCAEADCYKENYVTKTQNFEIDNSLLRH